MDEGGTKLSLRDMRICDRLRRFGSVRSGDGMGCSANTTNQHSRMVSFKEKSNCTPIVCDSRFSEGKDRASGLSSFDVIRLSSFFCPQTPHLPLRKHCEVRMSPLDVHRNVDRSIDEYREH